jgi:hypothetical protein
MIKRKPTFLQWLYNQKSRDDRVGDLAKDSALDKHDSKPTGRDVDLTDWMEYLRMRSACSGAYKSARQAWDEYGSL